MKLYTFLGLSAAEQYYALWSLGVHVDTHNKDNIAINLYSINDFYCEVYYDMETNKILYKQTAIVDYNKAIKINPKMSTALNNRGIVKAKLKDYRGAILDFTKTIGLNYNLSDSYHTRGNANYR
jgi:tetratricopeptide (TPR) repeat protein